MANKEHLEIIRSGRIPWNSWRDKHPEVTPDFSGESMTFDINVANLNGADLSNADLCDTFLNATKLRGANLSGANLSESFFAGVDFTDAELNGTDLSYSSFIDCNFEGARLNSCYIFGISVWRMKGRPAEQKDLVITTEPKITVDNIELAQFIYLMVNNQSLRDVIDTLTSKVVLILGRFTPDRKGVLDAIREELRQHNYLPILFDFEGPESRDVSETVALLARMSRFIIADLTEPSSLPKELEAIIPGLAVPVQPLLEGAARPYSMFQDYWKYDWVLAPHRYDGLRDLLRSLKSRVIEPAEAKVIELSQRRSAAAT